MDQPVLKYLQQISELEGIRYTQDQMTMQLSNKALSLGRERKVDVPKTVTVKKASTKGMKIGAIVGMVLPIIYYGFQLDGAGLLGSIWIFIKLAFFACLFTVVFMIVGHYIGKSIDKKKAKAINLENTIDAIAKMSIDKERVEKELVIQEQIKGQIRQIKQQRDTVTQALAQLYDFNIIHPKYRSLVPITTFCEYFETGRCTQLEGHEGAYNLYEQEVRLDRISTKLDVIAQKLDRIRESQYDLYQIISQTNATVSKVLAENERMVQSLNAIQENTELIAYNTHANTVATAAIGDMMVIRELITQ